MNIRKITALALAAALAACLLTACGSNTDGPAETEPAAAETIPAAETDAPEPSGQGGGAGTSDDSPVLGGWEIAESTEITPDRQEVFDRALEGLDGVGYTPEAYLASQVVAGTNHCYLCRAQTVLPDAQPYYTLAFIYEDANGGAEISGFSDLTEPASNGTAAGGWSAPESSEITGELQGVMDAANEVYDGASFVPIALLEEQVVAGMNYLFLCRVEPAGAGSQPYYALVKVFAPLEGSAEITHVQELVIGDLRAASTK